ncbi:hypothetical protein HanRHA438_Chr06g0285321 [Helianthus annuus]|nr:hypothetical protein HanRHA438_Chr06g0285321 [Helianthus annuus]
MDLAYVESADKHLSMIWVYFEISKGSHITTVKLGKILDEHGILLMPDSSSRCELIY